MTVEDDRRYRRPRSRSIRADVVVINHPVVAGVGDWQVAPPARASRRRRSPGLRSASAPQFTLCLTVYSVLQSSLPMHLSPHDAAAALADIENARAAMRRAIREQRGHAHFWIWGATWVLMPLSAQLFGDDFARNFWWFTVPAAILSARVAATQATRVRIPGDRQYFAMLAALIVFGGVFLIVLRVLPDMKTLYAYICLLVMQSYVIGGIWADTYLMWVGLIISALIIVGLLWFTSFFWIWMAVFGGGALIATGYYVRDYWR